MKTAPRALSYIGLALLISCSQPPKDPLLEKAEAGDSEAQFQLAERLADAGDAAGAEPWFLKALAAGHRPALRKAALSQLESDPSAAIAGLETLAGQSDLPALLQLAEIYERGQAGSADPSRALQLYQRAAELGEPYGRYRTLLAHWQENRKTMTGSERAEMKAELYEIASKEDPRAFSLYARILDEEGDISAADKRHLEAAKAGEAYSMYRIGVAYHRSQNNPTFGPLGFDYLQRAAAAGVTRALPELAKAYRTGNGVSVDGNQSKALLRYGAWLGSADAMRLYVATVLGEPSWELGHEIEMQSLWLLGQERKIDLGKRFAARAKSSSKVREHLAKQQRQLMQDAAQSFRNDLRADRANMAQAKAAFEAANVFSRLGTAGADLADTLESGDQAALFELGSRLLDETDSPSHLGELCLLEAADRMHIPACMKIYELYLTDGLSLENPAARARNALENAALLDDPQALLRMAEEYRAGKLFEQSQAIALQYAVRAAKAENPQAGAFIKELLLDGTTYEIESQTMLTATMELAAEGNPVFAFNAAAYQIADYMTAALWGSADAAPQNKPAKTRAIRFAPDDDYTVLWSRKAEKIRDTRTLPEDVDAAVQQIVELAENGLQRAIETTAIWHLYGSFLDKDTNRARAFLAEAREDTESIEFLNRFADAYLIPINLAPDFTQGSLIIRQAAELGHPGSQNLFSDLSRKAVETRDTPAKNKQVSGAELAYRAKALEDPESMFRLALFLKQEKIISQEYSNSQYNYWLGEAAKRDNFDALITISNAYMIGDGVEKNPRRGLRYLKRSADLGSANSQYHYGLALATGYEIEKNVAEGLVYLKKAAGQDYRDATMAIEKLQTEAQIAGPISKEEEKDVLSVIIANALGHESFPVAPFIVHEGRLVKIDSINRNRPNATANSKTVSGQRNEIPVLMPAESFHSARITIEEALVKTPFVILEDATIFTGHDTSFGLRFTSSADVEDLSALLIIRDRNRDASYVWRNIGSIRKGASKRADFDHDKWYATPEDFGVLFFSAGQEVASNIRVQPNNFLDSALAAFSAKKKAYLAKNETESLKAKITKHFPDFFENPIYVPLDSKATVAINRFGFAESIELPEGINPTSQRLIFDTLPFVTFFPEIEKGQPIASTLTVELD